jgi:hypothetical protein
MLTKTTMALVSALLLGSASSSFAQGLNGFDAGNVHLTATTRVPTQKHNGFTTAPARLESRAPTGVLPFSEAERAWMERASQSFW